MNIIKTAIVDPASDVFWDDFPHLADGMTAKPALILIDTYRQGSTDEMQLHKMLDACGLKQEQYNIIQFNNGDKAAWRRLRTDLDPKVIFLIGITPVQLGISALFLAHAPNNFNDRVWLPTLSLSELEQQPAIKKQLWLSGMKPIFVDRVFGEMISRTGAQ